MLLHNHMLPQVLLCLAGAVSAAPAPATVTTDGGDYTLTNGYVKVTFSTGTASISSMMGDFEGGGAYGPQVWELNPRALILPTPAPLTFIRPGSSPTAADA